MSGNYSKKSLNQSGRSISCGGKTSDMTSGFRFQNGCTMTDQTRPANTNLPPHQSHHSHPADPSAFHNKNRPDLKNFPLGQQNGNDWILDVLEDLVAFSQEHGLHKSTTAIFTAYCHVATELQT